MKTSIKTYKIKIPISITEFIKGKTYINRYTITPDIKIMSYSKKLVESSIIVKSKKEITINEDRMPFLLKIINVFKRKSIVDSNDLKLIEDSEEVLYVKKILQFSKSINNTQPNINKNILPNDLLAEYKKDVILSGFQNATVTEPLSVKDNNDNTDLFIQFQSDDIENKKQIKAFSTFMKKDTQLLYYCVNKYKCNKYSDKTFTASVSTYVTHNSNYKNPEITPETIEVVDFRRLMIEIYPYGDVLKRAGARIFGNQASCNIFNELSSVYIYKTIKVEEANSWILRNLSGCAHDFLKNKEFQLIHEMIESYPIWVNQSLNELSKAEKVLIEQALKNNINKNL